MFWRFYRKCSKVYVGVESDGNMKMHIWLLSKNLEDHVAWLEDLTSCRSRYSINLHTKEPPSSRISRYNYLLGVRPQIHHHPLMSKSPSFFQPALCDMLIECIIRHLENSSGNLFSGHHSVTTRRVVLGVTVLSASSNKVMLSEGWLLLMCFVWSLWVCVIREAVEILDRITSQIIISTNKSSVSPVSFRLASLAVAMWLHTVCYMKWCMSFVVTSVVNVMYLNS